MGMFGNKDFTEVESSAVPPIGPHKAIVTRFEVAPTKNDPEKQGLNITWTLSEGRFAGWDFRDWTEVREDCPDDEKGAERWEKNWSKIKRRMEQHGIPESRMNDVEQDDVLGTEVIITLAENKNDDNNPRYVRSVTLEAAASTKTRAAAKAANSGGKAEANPFA